MGGTYLVTGATGNVGREVARQLAARGQKVIAASRTNAEYRFDFSDPATWSSCLEGADGVFLMRPPHISNIRRDLLPFMRAMKERGVRHVIFLSVQGAESNRIVPHHKVEKYLRELDIPSTFVRPSFFMENLTTTHLEEIRVDGTVYVPAGKGKTNFIASADIGEAVAMLFLDGNSIGRACTLTGEKSYSYGEVAEYLGRGIGAPIRYVSPGPVRFLLHHLKRGRKPAMALVMLALYTVVKSGRGDITTTDLKEILGRPPLSLEAFIGENRSLFTEAE